MEAARVKPVQLSSISREDIHNTLHTHFHSQALTKRQAASRGANSDSSGTSSTNQSTGGRKRVFSFVQVQKKKVSLTSKRIFGHGGPLGGTASKYYILCVTVQDTGLPSSQQLHYLQLLSTFQVEVRQSWDIGRLDVIENNGLTSEKKRGSFALHFEGEDTPWQWLIADSESKFAMQEFLWSLCALSVDKKKILPRLVRIDTDELSEVAIHLNLQKKYNIDVDLLDHMASMKKANNDPDDPSSNNNSDNQANGYDFKLGGRTSGAGSGGINNLRLTSAENDDAAALLAGINWNDVQLGSIEDDLRKKLRALEDENITFLLSFEGGNQTSSAPSSGAGNQGSKTVTKAAGSTASFSSGQKTSVDRIIDAIDGVLKRIELTQTWTNESDDFLAQTSMNMMHFESLNNQLEMHFKNSVALQETLEQMMALVEIPREQMSILLKPLSVFPDEAASGDSTASSGDALVSQRDRNARMQSTIATIKRIDEAIKSTKVFPASDMNAFRTRGEELSKLARGFCDKLCASFDEFLLRKVKQWLWNSRAASTAGGSGSSLSKSRVSGFGRDNREASSSMRSTAETSRVGRAITSFEGGDIKEMDWTFTNEPFHNEVIEYQPLFAHLQSLDPRAMTNLRQVYAKNLALVYNPHVQSLFRCLKDKLPKSSKHHFTKPQALQSWSFHLSSSQLSDALGASPLLQQALDHVVPIVLREQRLLSTLFFPDHRDDNDEGEPEELALMMESVFEKLLKRMNDFGETASARNILDALGLVVLINGHLESYHKQSEFLFNVMVSFQLQMKRLLIKFTEDQEAWINNHNTDTRMAGVLSPILKTLVMIGRLEESVCGKTDGSTLASIYHRILPATLQWLEKVSDCKPKYRSLTRLENFLYISEKLTAINASKDLPLGQYAAQAHAKHVENLEFYVAYIWEYEFKQLVLMFNNVEELLKTLPAQEIQYHAPRQEVRKILEATGPTFEKSVKSMHDRMKKHFSNNLKLLPTVWKRLVEYAKTRLTAYEKIAADCYQLRMEPSPQRGVELLSKFAST
uniref:Exocyst complex component Sec3 C-terminal domain-containing protein n=1 Tax=Globisporangium ultimum (strain ATCC 200006 / CBS 805.95 / DAOM BR144) TaxID=431595 RepID=K3X6S8_GLOUD